METDSSVVILTFEIENIDNDYVKTAIADFVALVQERQEHLHIIDSIVMTGDQFYDKMERAFKVLDKIQEEEE